MWKELQNHLDTPKTKKRKYLISKNLENFLQFESQLESNWDWPKMRKKGIFWSKMNFNVQGLGCLLVRKKRVPFIVLERFWSVEIVCEPGKALKRLCSPEYVTQSIKSYNYWWLYPKRVAHVLAICAARKFSFLYLLKTLEKLENRFDFPNLPKYHRNNNLDLGIYDL